MWDFFVRVVARVFSLKSTPVMCLTHAPLREKDSRELPAKSSFLYTCLESSHTLSLTQPLQKNPT